MFELGTTRLVKIIERGEGVREREREKMKERVIIKGEK